MAHRALDLCRAAGESTVVAAAAVAVVAWSVSYAESTLWFAATAHAASRADDQRVAAVPLRQLNGRASCVGPGNGCVHVRGGPDAFVAWAVAPDQSSLYAVSDNGTLVSCGAMRAAVLCHSCGDVPGA